MESLSSYESIVRVTLKDNHNKNVKNKKKLLHEVSTDLFTPRDAATARIAIVA